MINIDEARRILAGRVATGALYLDDDSNGCSHSRLSTEEYLNILDSNENAEAIRWLWENAGQLLDELSALRASSEVQGDAAAKLIETIAEQEGTIQQLQAALTEERAIAMYKAVPQKNHDHLHKLPNFLQEDWRKKAMRELAREFPGLRWGA